MSLAQNDFLEMIDVGKKVLLDTFCKAGGCSMGYSRAGFDVVGVDKDPQPNYPFEFHQSDAIEFINRFGAQFNVVHSSPPCQAYSPAGKACVVTYGKKYPDLVGPTRDELVKTGRPFIIENVPQSPVRADVILFGYMFGLPVVRQRWFEIGGGDLDDEFKDA